EPIRWERPGDPATVDAADLIRITGRIAAASLIARHWRKTSRHDAALALAGGLLRAGWAEEEVKGFIAGVAEAAGDEELRDRVRAGVDTSRRQAEGQVTTGWRRLGELLGESVVDRVKDWLGVRREHSEDSEQATAEGPWVRPAPLVEGAILPSFPTEPLPSWLGGYVEAVAVATQTPPDLAGMLALPTLAAAVAGKARIEIKPGYQEPLNLYTVTALPPASRKSPVFAEMVAPLVEWEREEAERRAPLIEEWRSRYKIKEARKRKAEEEAARAKPSEGAALEEAAVGLARELQQMAVPTCPRLIADDASPEKLAGLLHEQGGRLAVMSAEGGVFEHMAGRYSNGVPNLDVYLKGHTGDELRVDRVNRPAEYVRQAALTMGLTVQPDLLRGLADKPGFRGRGLLARFLYALPQSLIGRRRIDAPSVPEDVRARYHRGIRTLLTLPADQSLTHVLRLHEGARASMRSREAWVEHELGEFGQLGMMQDWGGKLFGAVARIAGLLHLAAHADDPAPWQRAVGRQTLEAAWQIGEYLIPHARAAFAAMGADPVVEDARAILRWLARRQEVSGATSVTRRDIHQGNRGRFKRVEAVDAPIALLVEYGYIRRRVAGARHGVGQQPSPVFDVNPLWSPQNTQIPHDARSAAHEIGDTPLGDDDEEGYV
ncbi:MAG: YfjI family protein, partial [Chloroflexota bacterium]|nr:YfjI family protein [Chloroflexota bacterium]